MCAGQQLRMLELQSPGEVMVAWGKEVWSETDSFERPQRANWARLGDNSEGMRQRKTSGLAALLNE